MAILTISVHITGNEEDAIKEMKKITDILRKDGFLSC